MKNKFEKIAGQLQWKIEQGEYSSRLPSEQELALMFQSTTITIRKALDLLVERGYIRKVPYVGTFLQERKRKGIRIAWPVGPFPEETNRNIQERVKAHFRELDITFFVPAPGHPAADYDLLRVVGTTEISYSTCAMPLPAELIRKYRTPEYFQDPFDTHRINNFHYAVPILFSPAMLLLDLSQWDDSLPAPDAYVLDWKMLPGLGEYARRRGVKLWNIATAAGILRCLIFLCGARSGKLERIDRSRLDENMEKIWPLLSPEFCAGNGKQEECLIRWTCRQIIFGCPDHKRYLLAAYPSEQPGTEPLSMITGEFLLCSGNSKHQAEALQVAEYFLSPEIQHLIGESKIGLPVLKSAALDSIDSRNYRDDLFLNESRNLLTNNAAEQEFLLRLNSLAGSIHNREMSREQFLNYLEYEISIARRKGRIQQKPVPGVFEQSIL